MTPDFIAGILLGCVLGACGVFALTGVALWVFDVRRALREGELDGCEMERNRIRETP